MIRTIKFVAFLLLAQHSFAGKYLIVSQNGEKGNGLPSSILNDAVVTHDLIAAYDYLKTNYTLNGILQDDVTIYIREGIYRETYVKWLISSPAFKIDILGYPNEKPVFDGIRLNENGTPRDCSSERCRMNKFLNIEQAVKTNIRIRGLIIRNYVNGISFGKKGVAGNGSNTVENCVFENIGRKFLGIFNEEASRGTATISFANSNNNVVRNNIFVKLENEDSTAVLIHAVYLAYHSSNNLIANNYVTHCSGDPIKVRDGSNNNLIKNNYFEKSGRLSFVQDNYREDQGEVPSTGNEIDNNTFTFPYPYNSTAVTNIKLFDCCKNSCGADDFGCSNDSFIDFGNNTFYGDYPSCEKVDDIVSGDINGDGFNEVFLAFNYSDFTKLVKSDSKYGLYFSDVLFTSSTVEIGALELNDFDGDGNKELITAFNDRNGGVEIYRGNGNSVGSYGRIYSSPWFHVDAFSSGDFDNNGDVELITALNNNSNTQVYRGDGISSIASHNRLYKSEFWNIADMISGDFNGDNQEELITAFNAIDDSETQIQLGDGFSSIGNHGLLYTSAFFRTSSLTSGDFDSDGSDEIITAFNNFSNTQIYRGNGINSATNFGKLYGHEYWRTSAVGSSVSEQNEVLLSAFTSPWESQIQMGNAITSVGNHGKVYDFDNLHNQCNFNPIFSTRTGTKNIITSGLSTGIDESNEPWIYPNPSKGIIKFNSSQKLVNIVVFDAIGNKVKSFDKLENNEINLSGVKPGILLLSIQSDNTHFIKRVLIIE